ncbi:MAG TPA: L,D-transpeptidase family protein [Chitinophagaceae bacterium]|nr:L,D-transpeptidase family protein [Chitinophagaceae bacterium]
MSIRSFFGAAVLVVFSTGTIHAQTFLQQQLANANFNAAFQNKDSMLKAEFAEKHLEYPPRYIYIRAFKYDSRLEVWVKQNMADTFALFKTYRICALSGTMGPKRKEGDRQVPEGFYYINEFRPNSAYHLALGLDYPNYGDQILAGGSEAGGNIFIHGSCVTEGCIPLTDPQIEEVYLLAAYARSAGQQFIPVHIFPIRFDHKASLDYLDGIEQTGDLSLKFWQNLENAYDFFQSTHQIPVIMYDSRGNYVLQEKATEAASLTAR